MMIEATSPAYEIDVLSVKARKCNADGSPKHPDYQDIASIFRFPDAAKSRMYATTKNRRMRLFADGSSLTLIDPAWLFVCFEAQLPYEPMNEARIKARLTLDEWGFYTYEEDKLTQFRNGGSPPPIGMFSFSDQNSARKALLAIGARSFLESLNVPEIGTHIVFARKNASNANHMEAANAVG